MRQSETIEKLAAAFVLAQAELENVTKDKANPYFKSNYADLASILEVVKPILSKHGLAVLQPTTVKEGHQYVTTMLIHESGQYMAGDYLIKTKDDSDPQKIGSAVSYARRYSISAMLNIAQEDDDGNAGAGKGKAPEAKPVPPKPPVAPASKVHTTTNDKVDHPSPEQISQLGEAIKTYKLNADEIRKWINDNFGKPVSQCGQKEYEETMAYVTDLGFKKLGEGK